MKLNPTKHVPYNISNFNQDRLYLGIEEPRIIGFEAATFGFKSCNDKEIQRYGKYLHIPSNNSNDVAGISALTSSIYKLGSEIESTTPNCSFRVTITAFLNDDLKTSLDLIDSIKNQEIRSIILFLYENRLYGYSCINQDYQGSGVFVKMPLVAAYCNIQVSKSPEVKISEVIEVSGDAFQSSKTIDFINGIHAIIVYHLFGARSYNPRELYHYKNGTSETRYISYYYGVYADISHSNDSDQYCILESQHTIPGVNYGKF